MGIFTLFSGLIKAKTGPPIIFKAIEAALENTASTGHKARKNRPRR
ncbi:MAG: hypothetical protein ACE5GG_00055 [Candidatus Omnitrophota bacterium]